MPTQKIDPKVIFASDAPAIDKPPVFGDKTKGWDVSRANDGRPEIKQMNKMQQDTDLKILWLNENAVLPYDLSIDYPDGAVTLKDGSFKQRSSGSWVEFLDDFADKDAVKRGVANRYDSLLTYNAGERVVLTNGDIVKSTVDGNANDPNSDMTGWENKEKEQDKINSLLPTYADKSASLQAAINNSANGNTINLSGKTYPSGSDVDSKHLVGVGYNTRINVTSGEYGIKSLATSPIWNRYKIKDLTIEGDNLNGIGFTFDEADAASGRRNIEYVSFKWLDIAINKPSGNIGNTYSNCNFDLCNYGFKAVHSSTGVMMHSGCDTFRDAQFSNIKKWAIDIVNTTQGGGQFSIQDSIIQFCQGGGIRIDYGNTIPYAPITIRNVWFESIATSATVNRDGVDEVPREIKLINTPICIIEESYLKNIELINSTAIARYCRIDNSAEYPQFFIDSNSQLLLEYLYVDGFVPDNLTVKSIAKQTRNTSSGTDLSLCGEAPTSVVSSPQNASSFVGETYDGIVGQTTWELRGSQSINVECVRDGVLQESCIEIPLTNGITSVLNNIQLTAGKWAVWGVSAKAVGAIGGKFEFSRDFKLGDVQIKFDEWVHTFGIAKIATSGLVGCWIQPSSGGSLRLQNLFIAQFDNEDDAIAFANSRSAIDSRQQSASAPWNPPSLASGALQTAAITLNGAKIGDPVSVSFNQPLQGTFIWGEVCSDNNVTIYHKNLSATTVDLGLGVLSVHRI